MYQLGSGMGESTSSLDSLKEAVHDLKSQLDSITSERNILEKALRKVQKGQDLELESVLRHQSVVYESRLTELQSVIAELKKQLDFRRDKIIPEESTTDFEDHFEEDETDLLNADEDEYFEDNHFVQHPIINHTKDQRHFNKELSYNPDGKDSLSSSYENSVHPEIVLTINSTEASSRHVNQNHVNQNTLNQSSSTNGDNNNATTNLHKRSRRNKQKRNRNLCQLNQIHDLSNEVESRKSEVEEKSVASSPTNKPFASLCQEVAQIREEHVAIRDSLCKKETELDKAKEALHDISTERDFLRNKVLELESLLKSGLPVPDSKSKLQETNKCKLAERVQLRTLSKTTPTDLNHPSEILHPSKPPHSHSITGLDLLKIGRSGSTFLAEQLVGPTLSESKLREMEQGDSGEGLKALEFEMERLSSKVEHLKCQNDVLTLNLTDAKAHADQLTLLLKKYESNNIALHIAMNYSDETIIGYDILVALLESELGQLLANCRAAGIGSPINSTNNLREEEENINLLLSRANENRMTAENAARNLLSRLANGQEINTESNNNYNANIPSPGVSSPNKLNQPWDESSSSHTISSGSSSVETTLSPTLTSKPPPASAPTTTLPILSNLNSSSESRIRDLIIMLKTDRENVRGTIAELDSCWDMEALVLKKTCCDTLEARRMDLETAVLMQELMSMREERAELRAQLFLYEREKRSFELRVRGFQTQENVYKTKINHLQDEIRDLKDRETELETDNNANNSSITSVDRESVLKCRISELVSTLDGVILNYNSREKATDEMSKELKQANEMLIETLESCKRKYQLRLKKMEEQFLHIAQKHSMQIKFYKEQLFLQNN